MQRLTSLEPRDYPVVFTNKQKSLLLKADFSQKVKILGVLLVYK